MVGTGTTAALCAKLVREHHEHVSFLHYGGFGNAFVDAIIGRLGIPANSINKCNIGQLLPGNAAALVLSVNNMFVFPPEIVAKKNLTILNYHNSLLPIHRGVHAECWTIFEGDSKAGITWHKVEEGIDTGPILLQGEFPVKEDDTALKLLKKQASLALSLLRNNLSYILSGEMDFRPQGAGGARKAHLLKDWPWQGILDLGASNEKIWNFLRAMDYGRAPGYPHPLIRIDGELYSWQFYKRQESLQGNERDVFYIPGTGLALLGLRKYVS